MPTLDKWFQNIKQKIQAMVSVQYQPIATVFWGISSSSNIITQTRYRLFDCKGALAIVPYQTPDKTNKQTKFISPSQMQIQKYVDPI